MTSKVIVKHLKLAKADIVAGTVSFRSAANSFRSAANHIHAAVEAGATQAEAAATVGKSQSWVNRLLKWRAGGFKDGGPFAEDHARTIISAANNSEEPIETVNPHGHAFPHAKLYNVPLTKISRLSKGSLGEPRHLIANDDLRNYTISPAMSLAPELTAEEWKKVEEIAAEAEAAAKAEAEDADRQEEPPEDAITADLVGPATPSLAPSPGSVPRSAAFLRKMVANALEMLIDYFDGDIAATQSAVDAYFAEHDAAIADAALAEEKVVH